jgi:hypothetical protein
LYRSTSLGSRVAAPATCRPAAFHNCGRS